MSVTEKKFNKLNKSAMTNISKLPVSSCFPGETSLLPKPVVTEVKKNTLRSMVNKSQQENKFNWKTRTIRQPFCAKNPHLD